ncbi:hypothetical protein ElyMa_000067500 [Elysia marginata]|uniref:Uncharacterized protein n=1 Tax=Elysia marginata TaxID=1093978 RepID=A0AAV4EH45_9GAST|nr:hypothetical protein ElyMa_000067500 [Elysia marginata]
MDAIYRFYFHVGAIEETRKREQVSAKLEGSSVSKAVIVHTVNFGEKPSTTGFLRCCDKSEVTLGWQLVTQGNYDNKFQATSITWRMMTKAQKKNKEQGQVIAISRRRFNGDWDDTVRMYNAKINKATTGALQVLTLRCDKVLHENFISISVQFNRTKFIDKLNNDAVSSFIS